MTSRNNIAILIETYNRRLQKLKEKKASFGLDVPVHILTEIEDIEEEIHRLNGELKEVQNELKPAPQRNINAIFTANQPKESLEVPFVYNRPVPPLNFVGRKAAIDQILGRLATPARISSAICGNPRIGKTSLLHYLWHMPQLRESRGLAPTWCHFIYIYCDNIVSFSIDAFWRYVLSEVEPYLRDNETLSRYMQKMLSQDSINIYNINSLFDQIARAGRLVVLMLDGFEGTLETLDRTSPELLYHLRALLNRPERGLALLLVTHAPLKVLCASFRFTGSVFDNCFYSITLQPFSEAEVDELLLQYRANFSKSEQAFLNRIAGTHPYLVQLAGTLMVHDQKREALNSLSLSQIEVEFERETADYFSEILNYSSDSEKMLLTWLALSQLSQQPLAKQIELGSLPEAFGHYEQDLIQLIIRGLVKQKQSGPVLFSPVFGRWVIRKIVISQGQEVLSQWQSRYMNFLSPPQQKAFKNFVQQILKQPNILEIPRP